jgi:hypothetical protein
VHPATSNRLGVNLGVSALFRGLKRLAFTAAGQPAAIVRVSFGVSVSVSTIGSPKSARNARAAVLHLPSLG